MNPGMNGKNVSKIKKELRVVKTKIFFDTEFTGLHKNTTLISIGIVSDCGRTFYAEFTDYDKTQLNMWLIKNVMFKLKFEDGEDIHVVKYSCDHTETEMSGSKKEISAELVKWFNSFEDNIEMWSDCLAYDWVLFCDLFGGAMKIPSCIYYIPFDISTLFKIKGIDPDINRRDFSSHNEIGNEHNALYDALLIKKCYDKLMNNE